MAITFRLITWNCRQASLNSSLWDYLIELDPDVAILQDYRTLPQSVLDRYTHVPGKEVVSSGGAVRHFTGFLIKGEARELPLDASIDWVNHELAHHSELVTAKVVTIRDSIQLKAISVYNPAFVVDPVRLDGIDTTGVSLELQPGKVWLIDLVWAALASSKPDIDEPFILAGDFNASETFDSWWGTKPRGNREIMDRFNALGLYDALRAFQGRLVPTFRHSRGSFVHQLDHLYVTPVLLSRLLECDVGNFDRVFGSKPSLSDHLPIVSDFQWPIPQGNPSSESET
jgi:exonuclease III